MEEEFLLQNMVKDAMADAAAVASLHRVSIAVRGTHVRSHLGIESCLPTKGQEWKNKTSNPADLLLCGELAWEDVGCVVHYHPCREWSSRDAAAHAVTHETPLHGSEPPSEEQWLSKLEWVNEVRRPNLRATLGPRFVDVSDASLRDVFFTRAREYSLLDFGYRHGEFADRTRLVGPMLRLAERPDENMVGDHDLFAFADRDGRLAPDHDEAQDELQESVYFQAQHGGISYWNPVDDFYRDIKATIMAAHCAPHGTPLVVIHPDETITAMFYDPKANALASVWDCPQATAWQATTVTGRQLAQGVTSAVPRSLSSGQAKPE